jgi:hypothetical protein
MPVLPKEFLNLREEILKEHSKRQALKIAGWIGKDEKRFREFLEAFPKGETRGEQCWAYSLGTHFDEYPQAAKKHLAPLVKMLDIPGVHISVRRNVVRILQKADIPEKLQAIVLNKCTGYLSDPNETVAVRCFSMTVLVNLAEIYPEMKNETAEIIRFAVKNTTAGLNARARNELKKLQKA